MDEVCSFIALNGFTITTDVLEKVKASRDRYLIQSYVARGPRPSQHHRTSFLRSPYCRVLLRLLPRRGFVLLNPHLLLLALERRRCKALDLPQPSLRLVDVILPVVSLVLDVRLENSVDASADTVVCSIIVVKADRNVINLQADERVSSVRSSADVHVGSGEFDEVYNHVERWQTPSDVRTRDVFGERLFRGLILESACWMVN